MELKGRMNTWNLKKKMSFFLTLTSVMTSVIILSVSTLSAVHYMTEQSKEMTRTQLETLASNYDKTLEQYQSLAIALVIEESVQEYCKSAESSGEEYEREAGEVYDYLLNMLNVQSNMNFAVVEKYNKNKYVYKGNSSVVDARFELVYQEDYEESVPAKQESKVRMSFSNRYFRDGKYTLTIYHPIYSATSIEEARGMLIMNLNDSLIEQLHLEKEKEADNEMFLMDCNGKIVSVANQERIGKRVRYQEQMQGDSGSFQKNGVLINYQKVGKWNYYLVNEISVFELYKGNMKVAAVLVFVIVGMTVLSIFLLRKMMKAFYEPLDRVVVAMDDVSEGRLDKRINQSSMDEDSRKLAEGFNTMMDEIDGLMEQVKVEQHQIEQIRFNALQSQIKPHFLYNTLECIHWQALADGNKEICTMVKALAQYYRIVLSRGKEIIPLKQELEHIRSYLVIQNMRYDNIIELEDRIPEEFHSLLIPKMTLQPLIENAIYHGIRIKEGEKGVVTLRIHRENQDVYLQVCDSGSGMSQEKIDEMNQSISRHDETFGYGVRNVNKRIELLFGKEYGLRFFKNEFGGVTVEIHLPIEGKTEDKGVI